jgi:hypothetical protein
MQQIYIFNSWEECLQSAKRPTKYEQDHGITCRNPNIIIDDPEFKLVKLMKSDRSNTLVLLFKIANNQDSWINFIPTKNQFNIIISNLLIETINDLVFDNDNGQDLGFHVPENSFNSWEECLESAMTPTISEQDLGIECRDHRIVLDDSELKFVNILKSNNSSTLVLLYKKAKKLEIWIYLFPTRHQIDIMISGILKETIDALELENENERHFNY